MTHPTDAKRAAYQFLIQTKLSGVLTPAEIAKLQTTGAVNMIEAQAGGGGATDVVATVVNWVKTYPLFFKYSTDTSKESFTDSQLVYNGALTFAAAARELPETYRALHGENRANEPALDGLFALRSNGVDVGTRVDTPNLTGTTGSGTALTDAAVVTGGGSLFGTWGLVKYKAIMNKGVTAAIIAETDTTLDTIAEVSAVYDGYATGNQVPRERLFEAIDTLTRGGVSVQFSQIYALRNDMTNFNKLTSPGAIKLMASAGGSFATVSGLSAQKFADLTNTNAIRAIDKCAATYTALDTVYTANIDKYNALLTDASVSLCSKGYAGIDYAGLSTHYGTTYTPAVKKAYLDLVEPVNHDLFANGVSLANVAAAITAGRAKCFTPVLKKIIFDSAAPAATIYNSLVGLAGTDPYSGLEDIGFGPC